MSLNLKMWQKMVLVCGLFTIPIWALLYFLNQQRNLSVDFTRKEQVGVKYLRPLRGLLEDIQSYKSSSDLYSNGKNSWRNEALKRQAKLDKDFIEIEAVDRKWGMDAKSTQMLGALQSQWSMAKARLGQMNLLGRDQVLSSLISSVHDLFSRIGDGYNLILDPALDSYYTIDNVVNKIMNNALCIGRVEDLLGGSGVKKIETLPPEGRARLDVLSEEMITNMAEIKKNIQDSFANNPAKNLRPELGVSFDKADSATQDLLTAVRANVSGSNRKAFSQETYGDLAGKSSKANFDFWDSSLGALDELLSDRILAFQVRRVITLSSVFTITLFTYLLVFLILRSIQNSIRLVSDRMEEFARGEGDFTQRLQIKAKDEIGQLAESFNTFVGKLHEDSKRQLKHNEDYYRAIIEKSPDGIAILDAQGNKRYASPSVEKIMGYTPEEWMETKIFSRIDPPDLPRVRETFGQLLANPGLTQTVEFGIRRKDEVLRILEVTGRGHFFNGPDFLGVILNARDVTEAKNTNRVQEMLQFDRDQLLHRLQTNMEQMPIALVMNDLDFNITYWNPAAEKMFGFTFADVEGKKPKDLYVPPFEWEKVDKIFDRLKAGEKRIYGTINQNIRKDGQLITCEWYNDPILDEDGNFIGRVGMAIDITERQKAEESKNRLVSVLEQTTDGIIGIGLDGLVLNWNKGAERLYGYSADEIVGKYPPFMGREEHKALIEKLNQEVATGKSFYRYEGKRTRRDGSPIDIEATASRILDDSGKITGYSAIVRDITERKKAEESKNRLASILEQTTDAVMVGDLNGVITDWNEGAESLYGYSRAEILGKPAPFLEPGAYQELTSKVRKEIEKGGKFIRYEAQRPRRDGQKIEVEVTLSAVQDASGEIKGFSSIVRNITERKKAEETKNRLASILEQTHEAVIVSDLQGNILDWNRGAERVYGYSEKEVKGKSSKVLEPPDRAEEINNNRKQLLAGKDSMSYETVRRRKDGKLIDVAATFSVLRDENGLVKGFFSITRDITERKKAEEVMAQLADILRQTPDAVVQIDLEGRVFGWNRGAENMFGYTVEEIIGRPTLILGTGDQKNEMIEIWETVRKGGVVSNYETVRVKKNGDLVQVSDTVFPIRDATGRMIGVSAIFRDITEQKKAEEASKKHEEQMRLAQKMDAIGRLAGGVAHDFNNLLSVIGGNAEFMGAAPGPENPHAEEVEEIKKAVHRGAELTKQLLVFSQKQVVQAQPVNLNETGTELGKMLKRLLDAQVSLTLIQDKELKPILADSGQMQQVMMNLAINARDAMPRGGSLMIETKNIEVDDTDAQKTPSVPPGSYTRLTVTDTGEGMTPEIQKRIFEPFFTTKGSKGTGLGLATVYGIVNQWKGHVLVHSAPGLGTTFSLYFPVLEGSWETVSKAKTTGPSTRGSETILVAEDEDSFRAILGRALRAQGYQVLEAPNGVQALRMAREHDKPIHLLLTDTVMPKMNGKELADELHKSAPKLKVLFISGYPQEILSQQGILDPALHLMQKPFELENLVLEIRKILDEV